MQYCKIVGTEYANWFGVINGMVSSTSAQGDVLSVSITNDVETPLTEVYLPAASVKVVQPKQ